MQTLTFPVQIAFEDQKLDGLEQCRQACAEIEEAVTEALMARYGSVSVVAFSPREGVFRDLICTRVTVKE